MRHVMAVGTMGPTFGPFRGLAVFRGSCEERTIPWFGPVPRKVVRWAPLLESGKPPYTADDLFLASDDLYLTSDDLFLTSLITDGDLRLARAIAHKGTHVGLYADGSTFLY